MKKLAMILIPLIALTMVSCDEEFAGVMFADMLGSGGHKTICIEIDDCDDIEGTVVVGAYEKDIEYTDDGIVITVSEEESEMYGLNEFFEDRGFDGTIVITSEIEKTDDGVQISITTDDEGMVEGIHEIAELTDMEFLGCNVMDIECFAGDFGEDMVITGDGTEVIIKCLSDFEGELEELDKILAELEIEISECEDGAMHLERYECDGDMEMHEEKVIILQMEGEEFEKAHCEGEDFVELMLNIDDDVMEFVIESSNPDLITCIDETFYFESDVPNSSFEVEVEILEDGDAISIEIKSENDEVLEQAKDYIMKLIQDCK